MTIATAKKMVIRSGFVILSPEEYEKLLMPKHFKPVKATAAQKRAFLQAEKDYKEGKLISWDDAKKQLGLKN